MKKSIAFIYDHRYPELWKDGLYQALMLLSYDFKITFFNLREKIPTGSELDDNDFVLGWGAFGSGVDRFLQTITNPKGLCIAGNAAPPIGYKGYDLLFYETDWYLEHIFDHPNAVKAFGVNTKIYKPLKRRKVWDYITVGAFALWKRQYLLGNKEGLKLAIGEIQKDNPNESLGIVVKLLAKGVAVSDMLPPEQLCEFYNMSKNVYIPADIFGGGERAVLEARACGVPVDVEPDNPKLLELVNCELPTEKVYCEQLKKGVLSCL
jgi:hypothetical protein